MEAPDMRTPMIKSADQDHNYTWPTPGDEVHSKQNRSELSILLTSSFLLTCSLVLQFLQVAIALLFVGRIGKEELAAVSLACLTANVTGWSVFQGLASALDTLCPPAYGAGLKKMVGLHTQRMVVLLFCSSIPISLFWYNSYGFIQLLIHDDTICTMARDFLRILILGCPGFACFECGKRFLQAQGHFAASLYTFLVCIPVQILLTWYFVKHLGFGIAGIAASLSITRNMLPFGLVIYSRILTPGDCWRPMDAQIFQNWSKMVKLAIPSLLMLEADCIGFEILTILAGKFGTAELGAQALSVTLCGFIYKVPLALSNAAATEIGERLGEASAKKAHDAAKISLWLAGSIGSVTGIVLLSLSHHVAQILTNDTSVIALVQEIIPLIAVFQLFDAFVGVMNGVIRGIGRQAFGAWVQTLGYYAVGPPLSIFTAFSLGWRLIGLWTGLSLAMVVIFILEAIYLWFMDWEQLVEEARRRNDMEPHV